MEKIPADLPEIFFYKLTTHHETKLKAVQLCLKKKVEQGGTLIVPQRSVDKQNKIL